MIDGDTIEIRGERIRLHGIDAPESGQWCLDGAGEGYRCGQQTALVLDDRIGAQNVRCDLLDGDQYGRHIGRCFLGGSDLNEWMVRRGHAIKGNISRSGERIFHVPGQQHYGRTRIDEVSGERWFCSEEEAQAAGWRRAER